MKTALTIAGSDPTGGAGLQADLGVFRAMGVLGLSVPASLTAQSTKGVEEVWPVDEGVLSRQLEVLLGDIRPDALKTGMLYTVHAVRVAARTVRDHALENLVVDPVAVSSTGVALVDDKALETTRKELFPLARVITPNIYEAAVFTGLKVDTPEDMEAAAAALMSMGPEAVVVTGGHLDELALDVYHDGDTTRRMEAKKLEGEYHGTGCAFSAALAALLALGHAPAEAVEKAKAFVQNAIKEAHHPGRGMGILKFG